jgi:hypothetical protein
VKGNKDLRATPEFSQPVDKLGSLALRYKSNITQKQSTNPRVWIIRIKCRVYIPSIHPPPTNYLPCFIT